MSAPHQFSASVAPRAASSEVDDLLAQPHGSIDPAHPSADELI